MDGRFPHAQALRVGPELVDVPGGYLLDGDALLVCLADELVVNVGEVLRKGHPVAPVFQVPAQHVENAQGPGVPNVDEVIDRGAAGVDFGLALL